MKQVKTLENMSINQDVTDSNNNSSLKLSTLTQNNSNKEKLNKLFDTSFKVLQGFIYIYSVESQKIIENSKFLFKNFKKISLGFLNMVMPILLMAYFYYYFPQMVNSLTSDGILLSILYGICFYLAGFTFWLTFCLTLKLIKYLLVVGFNSLINLSENFK